jgi:PII-like signaling protein
LPILIEAVDSEPNVAAVIPELETMVKGGIITISAVEYCHYPPRKVASTPGQ